MEFRVGFGLDHHRFSEDEKKLVLCGVEFDERGLEGNSDADVALHSLTNAILQAIGEDDLDSFAGKMCKEGIKDSKEYLKVALNKMRKKNYAIVNVGITFHCKKPRITPKKEIMKKKLSELLDIPPERISIHATTGEGLSSFGRGEGIECFSVILLNKLER